jgi:hypothetical protein
LSCLDDIGGKRSKLMNKRGLIFLFDIVLQRIIIAFDEDTDERSSCCVPSIFCFTVVCMVTVIKVVANIVSDGEKKLEASPLAS